MSKQVRYILIACAAVAILTVAVILLKLLPGDEEKPYESDLLDFVVMDTAGIDKIEVTNSKGFYNITRGEDGVYVLMGDSALPVEQTNLTAAFSNLTHQYASQIVSENAADELEQYGFQNPSVVVIHSGTEETVYYVGDKNPVGSGSYAYIEGENTVYLLNTTPSFAVNYSANEFISTQVLRDIDSETAAEKLESFSLSGRGRDVDVTGRIKSEDDKETGVLSTFVQTSPIYIDISTDKLQDRIVTPLLSVRPTVAAIINPTQEDFDRCGLSVPYYNLSIEYDGDDYSFTVGDTNPDGYRYFYTEGINVIYLISEDIVSFMGVKSIDIISRILYLRYIDEFETITLQREGQSDSFAVEGDMDNLIAKLNGAVINTDDFKEIFQQMIGAFVQGEVQKPENASLYASLIFKRRDGKTDVCSYYVMDERKLYVELNGECNYYVNREDVDKLFTMVEKYK